MDNDVRSRDGFRDATRSGSKPSPGSWTTPAESCTASRPKSFANARRRNPGLQDREPWMFRFFERAINCGLICGLVALVPVTIGSAVARGEHFNQLYDFCSRQDCADGFWPEDGLGSDKDGNLYGTASSGGTTCAGIGCGTIFKLTPDGREITLYSFCSDRNCTGGYRPDGGVIVDTKGNIFGTTALGANYAGDCRSLGCGAVFKLAT